MRVRAYVSCEYGILWKDCCWTLISWCKMQTKIQHIKANMIQSSYDWSTIQHNLSINHGISYQFRSQYKAEVWNIPAIPITDADATPQVFSHLHIHHLLVMYPHRPHSRMCKSIASFNMSTDCLPRRPSDYSIRQAALHWFADAHIITIKLYPTTVCQNVTKDMFCRMQEPWQDFLLWTQMSTQPRR